MNFKAPSGLEVPEGLKPGGRFQVLATLELNKDGTLYLCEVDGLVVDKREEPPAKESIPDRAARKMGEAQRANGTGDGARVGY